MAMFVATGNESETSTATFSSVQWPLLCHHFEFHEILSATNDFDESLVIGHGSSAKVYKGNIKKGSILVDVAIKRLESASNNGSEFWAEVEMLSKLRHCHLVSLIGYCNHQREMILVYEYMPKGTLADHLHNLATPLSWSQRVKICLGAARGLDYLHTGTGIEFGIIHRDVKSSNILIDESGEAKVSDFGLAKITLKNKPSTFVSTLIRGTFGYFDPNYFATGKVSRKSDVYAFGVVLLEVLCRKRAVDASLELGMATWAQDSIKEGRLKDIVDDHIRREISPKCLKQYARIVERCLDSHPKKRPTMAEVVFSLEDVLSIQEKANSFLQTPSKTIFGRMIDKFSFIDNDQNSGKEFQSLKPMKPTNFESFMITKRHKGMNFRSLVPKKLHKGMNFGPIKTDKMKQNLAVVLEEKLKSTGVSIFRAKELKRATMNFSDTMIIGRGGYGVVYKGILPDQRVAAIKKSKISDHKQLEQFVNELVILAQIYHRNVVQIWGCCLETEVPLLVYEYVSNGSLFEHLHKTSGTDTLSWDSRLRIAHETADALAFVHTGVNMPIIHRDVKSSNILLDETYIAKVSDFGASRLVPLDGDDVTTLVQGTLGYLDPEYFHTSKVTDKSDVYSFGVVLAELLTGSKAISMERSYEDRNLATYLVNAEKENRLYEIVDPRVLDEMNDKQLEAASHLASRCLCLKGEDRPGMKEVAMELERIRKFIPSQYNNEEISSLVVESDQVDLLDQNFDDQTEPGTRPASSSSLWVGLVQFLFVFFCKIIFNDDLFSNCEDLNPKPLM